MRRPALAILASSVIGLAGCGDDGEPQGGGGGDTTAGQTAPAEAPGAAGGCREVPQPQPKPDGGRRPPRRPLDARKTYTATVRTNCGDFAIQLDLRSAPKTAASFVSLARSNFYDGTVFHRIVSDFVIQGGDPTGTGTGGPGYQTVDPPPSGARYSKGVVAMAKTAQERPGTAGSQFYVVTAQDAGLPPEYAVLGKVTEGIDVIDRIGALGSGTQEGTPTAVVVIEDVTVRAS